jgi:hypothetical protein
MVEETKLSSISLMGFAFYTLIITPDLMLFSSATIIPLCQLIVSLTISTIIIIIIIRFAVISNLCVGFCIDLCADCITGLMAFFVSLLPSLSHFFLRNKTETTKKFTTYYSVVGYCTLQSCTTYTTHFN